MSRGVQRRVTNLAIEDNLAGAVGRMHAQKLSDARILMN
jgi:hypothetical protein